MFILVCISGFMCMTDSLCDCVHVQEAANGESTSPQMSFLGELGNTAAALLRIHYHTHMWFPDQPRCTMRVFPCQVSIMMTAGADLLIYSLYNQPTWQQSEAEVRTGEGINVYLALYDL